MKIVKNISVAILKCVLMLVCAGIIGLLLLVTAYCFPVNQTHKEATFEYMEQIGWSPRVNNRYESYKSYFNTFEPGILDDGTDRIILSYTFDENRDNLFERAVYMNGYGRYWHGYVVFLRFIFYFVDYWDFILLNGMLQISIVTVLCILVWKKTLQMRYVFAVLSSYLLLMPLALAFSLQFSPVFYLAFLGSIAVFLLHTALDKKRNLCIFFFILGIGVCYIDFLTNPLLVWAFPLCWYFVAKRDVLTKADRYISIAATAVSWIIGYVGMFLVKWFLLYLICGPAVYQECDTGHAFSLLSALSDDLKVSKETYSRFDVLFTNWRHYLFAGFAIIITAWVLWGAFTKIRYGWKVQKRSVSFLVITFSSIAWYLVFASHTAIHHFFTYRTFGASILAYILFISECTVYKRDDFYNKKKRLLNIAAYAFCLCMGAVLVNLARENVRAFNGGEHQLLKIRSGDVYECSFVPTFEKIHEFAICAQAPKNAQGNIIINIGDERSSYEAVFPVREFTDSTYSARYTDWSLKAGKEYRLSLTVEGGGAYVELLVTKEGNMPFNEYRNARLNGNTLGEVQLLGEIMYFPAVQSRLTKLFLILIIGCYLELLLNALYVCSMGSSLDDRLNYNETKG